MVSSLRFKVEYVISLNLKLETLNAKKALVLNFVARELFEKFSLRRLAVFLKWSKLPLNRHFLAFKFLKASLKELSAIYRINTKRVKHD